MNCRKCCAFNPFYYYCYWILFYFYMFSYDSFIFLLKFNALYRQGYTISAIRSRIIWNNAFFRPVNCLADKWLNIKVFFFQHNFISSIRAKPSPNKHISSSLLPFKEYSLFTSLIMLGKKWQSEILLSSHDKQRAMTKVVKLEEFRIQNSKRNFFSHWKCW